MTEKQLELINKLKDIQYKIFEKQAEYGEIKRKVMELCITLSYLEDFKNPIFEENIEQIKKEEDELYDKSICVDSTIDDLRENLYRVEYEAFQNGIELVRVPDACVYVWRVKE